MAHLQQKIRQHGIRVLFNGSVANSVSTVVGHFPWFMTFNALNGLVRVVVSLRRHCQAYLYAFSLAI